MIYFWGVLAGGLAVLCEAMFKRSTSYLEIVWIAVPLALVINYSIFRMVQLAPSLPSAFIVFGAMVILCRTVVSLYLNHPIGSLTWGAVGLNIAALVLREIEKRWI